LIACYSAELRIKISEKEKRKEEWQKLINPHLKQRFGGVMGALMMKAVASTECKF
jgi:hypothetical protein